MGWQEAAHVELALRTFRRAPSAPPGKATASAAAAEAAAAELEAALGSAALGAIGRVQQAPSPRRIHRCDTQHGHASLHAVQARGLLDEAAAEAALSAIGAAASPLARVAGSHLPPEPRSAHAP